MEKNYDIVHSVSELRDLVDKILSENQPFGFDIETGYDGPDRNNAQFHPEEGKVVGISFTNSTNWARYAPMAHDYNEKNLLPDACAPHLWRLLKSGLGVAHNAKFEESFLSKFFMEFYADNSEVIESCGFFPMFSDTMLEAYVKGEFQKVGLKIQVFDVFNHKMTEFTDLFPANSKVKASQFRFNVLELSDEVVSYACEDSLWCLALHKFFYPQVKDQFIYKLEMGILPVLCEMEDFGIKLDWKFLHEAAFEARKFLEAQYDEIMADASKELGRQVSINLGSATQVRKLLYEDLGMTGTRVTKGSRGTNNEILSTDAIAMERLAKESRIVKKILEWREMKKLIGSYLEKFPREFAYDQITDMAHPRHKQASVVTGRFSCADPNYQQLPKKYHYVLDNGMEFNLKFRNAVIAPEGFYFCGFDFSQVELRVLAGESGEPSWLQAFAEGTDIHVRNAALVLGKKDSDITEDERDIGKLFGFALGYGLGIDSLADRLACSYERAEEIYNGYFEAVPVLRDYIEEQHKKGRRDGYVTTHFGRKMTIWEYQSQHRSARNNGDRAALNYQIQGAGTGDLPKMVMLRVHKTIKDSGLQDKIKLVMNVHDELNFYVHESIPFQEFVDLIRPAAIMKIEGWPKIEVEWHKGFKWGELEEFKTDSDGKLVPKKTIGAPEPEAQIKDVLLKLGRMPTSEEVASLKKLAVGGPNLLTLEVPEGKVTIGNVEDTENFVATVGILIEDLEIEVNSDSKTRI